MSNLKEWISDLVQVIGFIGVVSLLVWIFMLAAGPARTAETISQDSVAEIKQQLKQIEMRLVQTGQVKRSRQGE